MKSELEPSPPGRPNLSADRCWAAVLARDAAADGCFVYSVSTTGIYCRPGCGARRPRREHVAFHATPAEAERAGFRPCRRCHPRGEDARQRRAAQVAAACRRIESAGGEPTLGELARAAGMSASHFHRLFRATLGITPKQYAAALRNRAVRGRLAQAETVTEAIYQAGFETSGRFYATSNQALGMTPSAFRRGGRGVEIGFALGHSTLGAVLVAQSGRGVCAILLGDDPAELIGELARCFPKATLKAGDSGFEQLVAAVVALVEAPAAGLDLPLDIRGTAFQQRVWRALVALPPGTRATYQEIANAVGRPRAVRAVAQACAANRLAVAVPCHRVLRRDGGLAGYRWGVERKRALLEREAQAR